MSLHDFVISLWQQIEFSREKYWSSVFFDRIFSTKRFFSFKSVLRFDNKSKKWKSNQKIEKAWLLVAYFNWEKVLWYSGLRLQLLHRWPQFDPHSRRFIWQVNEPLSGSTHALWGKWGSQLKVLTGQLHSVYNHENGLLSLLQFNYIKVEIDIKNNFLWMLFMILILLNHNKFSITSTKFKYFFN